MKNIRLLENQIIDGVEHAAGALIENVENSLAAALVAGGHGMEELATWIVIGNRDPVPVSRDIDTSRTVAKL